ncbi:MFS transporter [Streptomyces violaceusniger]|uniref:Major facilitator superfamily MFS_1 n=1 Tax=Streptomyces violaceusniger (strain Tu 4113) TaxID=653045 RepID=G2NVM2_STRV4|nr:MFS transporter [Streptomyces violaceusniger]AEM85906.1 major facilitator superfamily MFS_1 [Streptomyces violaceusniger Tu 4113]
MTTTSSPGRVAIAATLGVVTAALFAYSTLETMLSPALPAIQHAVGASTSAIAWVFTGLLLAGAVSTPLVGRLGDIRDKRTVLLGVLAVVALGTLVAALATNVALLTAGQVLQGVGLSLVPLSVGIIRDTQPARRIAAGNGLIVGTAASSTAVGLVVAGPILEVLPYTWLYWIPFAVIVAAFVVAWAVVPSCPPARRGRIDSAGAVLLALGLALLLIGISRSSKVGWGSPLVLSLVVASVAVLGVFAAVELRTSEPLVDLRLLATRAVLLTCAVAFVVGFGTFAVFVLVPMLVELPKTTGYGLGGSALSTGLYLVPLGIVGTAVAPLTGRLERAIGTRGVMLTGTTAMVAAALVLLAAPGRPWLILISTALAGLTVGFGLTGAMNIVVATVPEDRTASVSGLAFVVKSVGGALGAQLGAVMLARSTAPETELPAWSGFRSAFLLAAAVSMAAVLLSIALPSRMPRVTPSATTTVGEPA